MSGATVAAGVAQVVGGVVLAPLLPGLVQHLKARLQGRRGPTPLQPYRELRRLWGKSAIDVEGTTVVYRLAPLVVAAALAAAILLVPAADRAPGWGVGHDALALAGLLALARFAIATASWDVSNGFSLQGASRDLTLSVFVEAVLVLALAVAALVTGTTDLRGVVAGTAGGDVWSSPALALGAAAFALVVIAETGRQPVDNPDTHLELTMIHEGPVLEYGGRDLAFLQWAAAARHWLVLVLAAQVFLPHPEGTWWQLALLPAWLIVLCAALALTETIFAKIADPDRPAPSRRRRRGRTARHRRLARGGDVSGGLTWTMVALGIGVVVFRRRSVAVGLVTAQALLLALEALREASSAHDAAASVALGVRGVALAVFFWLLVHRTRETRPVRAGIEPLARGGAAIGLALALIWLIPDLGLDSAAAERSALTLVAIGLVTAATRRATLFQVLGIVLVENGLAVAALALPGELVARDRARRRVRPAPDRARRRRLPRADLRRVRRRRLGGPREPAWLAGSGSRSPRSQRWRRVLCSALARAVRSPGWPWSGRRSPRPWPVRSRHRPGRAGRA